MDPCAYQECLVREMQCLTSKLAACQEEEKRLKRAQYLCLQNQYYPCLCGRYGCRCNMRYVPYVPCVPYVPPCLPSPKFVCPPCPPCPPCPLIPAVTTKFEERIQPMVAAPLPQSKSAQVIVAPKPSPYESTILSHKSNQQIIASKPVSNQAILVPSPPSKPQSAANQRIVMPKAKEASNQKIRVPNADQKILVSNTNQRVVMPKKNYQMAPTKDQQKIMVKNERSLAPKKTFVSNQAVVMPKTPTESKPFKVNQGVSMKRLPSNAALAKPAPKTPTGKSATTMRTPSKSATSKTVVSQGVSIKRPASTAPSAKSPSKKTVTSNQAVVMPRKNKR